MDSDSDTSLEPCELEVLRCRELNLLFKAGYEDAQSMSRLATTCRALNVSVGVGTTPIVLRIVSLARVMRLVFNSSRAQM